MRVRSEGNGKNRRDIEERGSGLIGKREGNRKEGGGIGKRGVEGEGETSSSCGSTSSLSAVSRSLRG